jgi:hypothetical protein
VAKSNLKGGDMEKIDTAMLLAIAEHLRKNQHALMDSIWQNSETEAIVHQTICASDLNFRKKSDAFSWVGNNVMQNNCFGPQNYSGLRRLLDGGYMIMESYRGECACPENTHMVDGAPQILRITNKLLQYVFDKHLN